MSDSSNMSWHEQSQESEQIVPGRKPIKKKKKKHHQKTHKMISSTYQKKKCDFFNKGTCQKGAQCTFSHNFVPDFAKKICKFFLSNSCAKGENCSYSHNTKRYPCKFYHLQNACNQAEMCRFSHDDIDPDFLEEFLKDNEDFLIKLYKTNKLQDQKYVSYVKENNLQEKGVDQQLAQSVKSGLNLPYILGYSAANINSGKDQGESRQVSKTDKNRKKNNNSSKLLANQKKKEKPTDPRLVLPKNTEFTISPFNSIIQNKKRQESQKNVDNAQIDISNGQNDHEQPQRIFSSDNEKSQGQNQQQIYKDDIYGIPYNIHDALELFMCSYY